jgi:hypothetical protein
VTFLMDNLVEAETIQDIRSWNLRPSGRRRCQH